MEIDIIAENLLDIETKIMLAIWHLTEGNKNKYVSNEDIAQSIRKNFKTEASQKYVRRVIREKGLTNKFDTRKEPTGGRKSINWRLHKHTIVFPQTAFILNYLSTLATEQRIPTVKLNETFKYVELNLGLTREAVQERIDAALDKDILPENRYLIVKTELDEPCYSFTFRYKQEIKYIEQLALIAKRRFEQQVKDKNTLVNPLSNAKGDKTDVA